MSPTPLRRRLRLAVAVILAIGLVTDAAVLVLLSRSVSGLSTVRHADLVSCQAANVTRAQDITLWEHILALPGRPQPGQTAAQRAQQITAFRVYVHKVYAPRDCTAIYGR